MREIKFRAWHKDPLGIDVPIMRQVNKMQYVDGGWVITMENNFTTNIYELMQYTGLKDKNGVEIYEGDIVIHKGYPWFDLDKPNYRGTVEWVYSQWQVIQHCVNPNKRGISDGMNVGLNDEGIDESMESGWEVIGNIYENRELLNDS